MLALLNRLRGDGVPLDGLGLQTHLTTSFHPGRAELRATMRRYASLGLAVDVSEMDVAATRGTAPHSSRRGSTAASRPAATSGLQPLHHLGLHGRLHLAGHREAPAPVQCRGEPKPAWRAIRAALRR